MYQAMARRYRPSTFDEVIGQEHVARTLKNALQTDRVAHAYLFCGPHGCGKTSMARIFARALVCERGPTATPCGECAFCRDIMRGQDIDVREIDGASNNKVEEVRQLREQVGYVPTRARYKIYIIDEVHMLSVAAFNALLKTLEEPPPHVKFILATTDPHKLPDTVISRCQRFDFRLVPPATLAGFFKELAVREGAAVESEALEAVAAFSGGSVRDGLVLLDQLLSYAQGTVTREDVERVRGVAGAESVAGIFLAVARHEVKEALAIVDEVASRGTNVGDFLDQLIEFGRDLMLLAATGGREGVSAYGPAREALERLGEQVSLDQALLFLDVLAQARTRVRSRALSNQLVPLEMAVARLAGLESLEPLGETIRRLEALASGSHSTRPVAPPPLAAVQRAESVERRAPTAPISAANTAGEPGDAAGRATWRPGGNPQPAERNAPGAPAPVKSQERAASETPPWEAAPARAATTTPAAPAQELPTQSAPVCAKGEGAAANLVETWGKIVALVQERHAADAAYLKHVAPAALAGGVLSLSAGGGSFVLEMLEDARRKERLAAIAAEVLGQAVTVRYAAGIDAPALAPGRLSAGPSPEQRRREEAVRDPAVQLIVDEFSGSVIGSEPEDGLPR